MKAQFLQVPELAVPCSLVDIVPPDKVSLTSNYFVKARLHLDIEISVYLMLDSCNTLLLCEGVVNGIAFLKLTVSLRAFSEVTVRILFARMLFDCSVLIFKLISFLANILAGEFD